MMSATGFCCGSVPQKASKKANVKIELNPIVKNGVEVIYLGAGNLKVTAAGSGNTYYATDHQRNIKVEQKDLQEILRHREIIQKP